MNYPVNPDLMPALMAVFQHVRTRIQSELDCQRLDLTPPDVHVLKLIDEQRGLNLQDLGRQMCRDKATDHPEDPRAGGKKPGPPRAQPQ